jgi:hypothetical protein
MLQMPCKGRKLWKHGGNSMAKHGEDRCRARHARFVHLMNLSLAPILLLNIAGVETAAERENPTAVCLAVQMQVLKQLETCDNMWVPWVPSTVSIQFESHT